jgi:hypothetical protein
MDYQPLGYTITKLRSKELPNTSYNWCWSGTRFQGFKQIVSILVTIKTKLEAGLILKPKLNFIFEKPNPIPISQFHLCVKPESRFCEEKTK